jgi:hypothetical protein
MPVVRPWCEVRLFGRGDIMLAHRVLDGPDAPDLAAIDEIATLARLARRIGGRIVIDAGSPELWELLELCGLALEVKR